eukprot:gene4483-4529_t
MLKTIRTDQVELGMFIQRLEGSWFSHPFWKVRFVLDDPARLAALRSSAVTLVTIDAARGRDVAPEGPLPDPAAPAPAPATLRRLVPGARATAVPSGRRSVELSAELARAERLTRQAGKAISRLFVEVRLGRHVAASDVEPVIEEIYASIQRNIYAFNGLLLCQSDQAHLYRHALAVSALMVALARRMRLSPRATREAAMVGLLMDLGLAQVAVDADVFDYRDLPDDLAQGHVIQGATMLRAAGDIPPDVLNACLHHHERLDGSGYPHGLSGEAICLFAQMAALCDDYVLLVTGSCEVLPFDPACAIEHLRAQHGRHDGALLAHLVDALGVYPIGSFVRLRSGRLAMVVDQDEADSALPVVRIFARIAESGAAAGGFEPLRPVTLALGRCYGEDAIEGLADAVGLNLPPLETMRHDLMAGAIRSATR